MNIRMICMDLDGTALQPDRDSFSSRLETALQEAHRRGVIIAVVTGRQFGLLPAAVAEHPVWEDLAVTCNGGQVRKLATGELLYGLNMDAQALRQLLEIAGRYDLPVEFSVDSRLYLTAHSLSLQQADPGLAFHRDSILARYGRIVDTLEPLCTECVEKVNLLCIPGELRETVVRELEKVSVSAVWSSRNCMEITHHEADKGRGLEALCRLRNILPEQTMAMGDSGNDIAMLRQAGLGVAMGNAPDFVKDAAAVVTDRYDRDGAAKAIERFVLGWNENGNHTV